MITIYGNERCGWCRKAKNLAEQYELKYEWLDTDEGGVMDGLRVRIPDVKTIPQIWWHDRHIGGYTELLSEIQNTIGNYGQGTI